MNLKEIEIGNTYEIAATGEQVEIVEKTSRTAKYEDADGNLQSVFAKDLIEIEGEYELSDLVDSEGDDEDESEDGNKMAAHIRKYRTGYNPTFSYNNTRSLHNGDPIAQALEGLSPTEVCTVAETLIEDCPDLSTKYAKLNVGQIRMNAGNRIRNAVKNGEVDVDAVAELAAELLEERLQREAAAG